MVVNVHTRELPVAADEIGLLLDRVGGPGDRLWPAPTWPAMVLDGPLGVGVEGHHGPISYYVCSYKPGRMVEFTFKPGVGMRGVHVFDVEPLGPDRCVLRHTVMGRTTGSMRLVWPLAMRWLHDACVEDLLDRAESAAGVAHRATTQWSPWVRMIRRATRSRAHQTPVPETPLLVAALPTVDWSDAYAVRAQEGWPTDPLEWADAVFHRPPVWICVLLGAREVLVKLVGIDRAGSSAFDPIAVTDDEVLLGIDQSHLSFRASVLREPDRVVVSTVVQLHNRRGRLYSGLVRRIHPLVVSAMLTRAARRLGGQVSATAPSAADLRTRTCPAPAGGER